MVSTSGLLTVIVPALNEAGRLPALFDSLARQTCPPDAVVVADAGSTDGTREVAEARGAIVVEGGSPAEGRNAGAAVADTDLLLFLDADVELDDDALEVMTTELAHRDLVAASAMLRPTEDDERLAFACDVVDLYLEVMEYVSPHAPGCCILVRRDVHEAIGGFDTSLALAEDHDYVRRAAERGRFRMLRGTVVRTSMRRIEKEGLAQLAFKYLYAELHVLTGRPLADIPFDYEFAAFDVPAERAGALDGLRERLSDLRGAVGSMSSEGLDAVREAAGAALDATRFEAALARMGAEDLRALGHYVHVRARYLRRGSRRVLKHARAAAESALRDV